MDHGFLHQVGIILQDLKLELLSSPISGCVIEIKIQDVIFGLLFISFFAVALLKLANKRNQLFRGLYFLLKSGCHSHFVVLYPYAVKNFSGGAHTQATCNYT